MLFVWSLVGLLVAYISLSIGEAFGGQYPNLKNTRKWRSIGVAFLVSFGFALIVSTHMGTHDENCSQTDASGIDCDEVRDFKPTKGKYIDKFFATFSIAFLPYLVGFKRGRKQ